ncbi:MAG TPA: hypothetical protein VMV89_03655 [Candidatus Paceibacterota bacterium]|nr:hypothetical protein [Candidatus Paceibacterota bacterium]
MKSANLILLAAIVALAGWRADAQTNVAPVIRTNLVTAAENFREVNGKLYNSGRSVLWKNYQGECLKVLTNGILVQTFTIEPVFEATTTSRPIENYMGGITGYRQVPTTVQTGTKEVPSLKFFLRNYPANKNPADGETISFRALRTGTIDYNGETLELWDYGTPHVAMVVTTNYPRAFK